MKKKDFALGILCGAMLFSGATAVAAGITAEPTWQKIYVDGEQVPMTTSPNPIIGLQNSHRDSGG